MFVKAKQAPTKKLDIANTVGRGTWEYEKTTDEHFCNGYEINIMLWMRYNCLKFSFPETKWYHCAM